MSKRDWVVGLVLVGMYFGTACHAQSVALTFDDLPETGDTPKHLSRARIGARIVRTLKKANAREVYGFVNASNLDDPDTKHLLERWRKAGFLLGNHTFTHPNLDEVSLAAYEKDIADNEPVVKRLMAGQDWHWFRYPYLAEGATFEKRDAIRSYLKEHGYRIAEVTIDFGDSYWDDPYARCVDKKDGAAVEQLKTLYLDAAQESIRFAQARSQLLFQRDIPYVMLLHYGAIEAVMLPELLKILRERGFKLVTLPEAESDPVYAIDPHTANDGGTLLDDLMEANDELEDTPHHDPDLDALDRMCR